MIRFFILSILLCAASFASMACGPEPLARRYYIFYAGNQPASFHESLIRKQADAWSNILSSPITKDDIYQLSYLDDKKADLKKTKLMRTARKRRDSEAVNYLNLLGRYLNVSDKLYKGSWDYPSKADIAKRADELNKIALEAGAYKGNRFRQQYQLLGIRCAFSLNDWQKLEQLWKQASKTPGVYADMMENYYAGALYRQGNIVDAAAIYIRQGDFSSAYYCNLKWGDAEGIRQIYNLDPNSDILPRLIKQFCDDTQETFDNIADGYIPEEDEYNYTKITDKACRDFVDLALSVIEANKASDLLMWANAASLVSFYQGDFTQARRILDLYGNLPSSAASQRCNDFVKVFVNLYSNPEQSLTRDAIASNLALLDDDNSDHARRMLERYVYLELAPRLRDSGDSFALLAALSISNPGKDRIRANDEYTWAKNLLFGSPYFSELDSMPLSDVMAWKEWLASNEKSKLLEYALKRCNDDGMMLTELIGTRLMRSGNFKEAANWMAKVPSKYISALNVSPYMACRDFRKVPWTDRREITKNEYVLAKIKNNPKLDFCKYVMLLEENVAKAKGTPQEHDAEMALAAAYYQASPDGPCWWLTRYGTHSYPSEEEIPESDKDFAASALALVNDALKSSRLPSERLNALFARAYLTPGYFSTTEWDTNRFKVLYYSDSYKAYKALDDATANLLLTPDYISRCDVLNTFRALPPSPIAAVVLFGN